MTDLQAEKVKRFMNDQVMAEAVKEVIREAFLKARSEKDVHYLAAKSLSIEYLEDAWRDLGKYRQDDQNKGQKSAPTHL